MNWNLKIKITEIFDRQYRFAAAVGEGDPVVSRVIRGLTKLDPARQKKWAEALRCKVSDIFE